MRTIGNIGEIFLNDPSAIDYETQRMYTVRVSVQDNGATRLSSSIDVRIDVIDVDDNDPMFANDFYSVTIPETAPIDSFIIQVQAEDPDSVTNFAHQIQGNDSNPFFYINATNGKIFLRRSLNHESNDTHYLNIETFNLDSPNVITDTATVTIYVSDENDLAPFFLEFTNQYLDEGDSYMDEFIVTLTLVDLDVNHMAENVQFELLTESQRFYINRRTDPLDSSIAYADLYLTGDVDFESQPIISVTIRALDDNTTSAQSTIATVFIFLNNLDDEDPIFDFDLYEATVEEGAITSTIVEAVHADDPDVGVVLTYGIHLRLVPPNSAPFIINTESGVIQVSDVSAALPDFETIKYYTIEVCYTILQSTCFDKMPPYRIGPGGGSILSNINF